jgi:hypothetical protein
MISDAEHIDQQAGSNEPVRENESGRHCYMRRIEVE